MEDISGAVALLRASLQRLASGAQEQLLYLDSGGVPAGLDELALELDDVEPLVPQLVQQNLISRRAAEGIHDLGELLRSMSGKDHAAFWTPEALENSQIWSDVRKKAATALKELPD